jgi:hypothetical protein
MNTVRSSIKKNTILEEMFFGLFKASATIRIIIIIIIIIIITTYQWRTEEGFGGFKTPPKFRSFDKAEPNSQFRGKYVHNSLIRIWVSLICKLSGTPD